MDTKQAITNLMNVANSVLPPEHHLLVIKKDPIDKLLKAVRDLIQDIDEMRTMQNNNSPHWFGPFSEYVNAIESVGIDWPNLSIDHESLKKALAKYEGDNV